MANSKKLGRKKVQGVNSPRRHRADIKRQLEEVRTSHFLGNDIDELLQADVGDNPRMENLVRRFVRGGAIFMAQRAEPSQQQAVA